MYKSLVICSLFALFSCADVSKQVNLKEKETVVNPSEEKKPTLSTDLVTNPNTAEENVKSSLGPQFSFETELHDFGQLIDGEKVSYSFKFTNSGDQPLIISNAKGSCGCTVPNWPKDPIQPGDSGTIDVTFNSSGRTGKQNKAITLTANTNPSRKVINITSEVISN